MAIEHTLEVRVPGPFSGEAEFYVDDLGLRTLKLTVRGEARAKDSK